MLVKSMAAALLSTSLLAGAAFAQTPMTTTSSPSASTTTSDSSSHQGQWRTSKLIGLNVYNDSNEKLGDINELLIDQSGKIQAVIVGVGGFLGMGEHNVAVTFDKIKFVNEPVATASNSNSSTTAGTRPAGSASNAPMTTTGTSTTSGTTTTAPMTTTGTGTGMSGSSSNTAGGMSSSHSNWYPDHAMLSATKDQLKGMTEFKYQ